MCRSIRLEPRCTLCNNYFQMILKERLGSRQVGHYFQKRRPPENADAISRALASIGQSPNLFWGRSRFSQVPKKFGEKSGQMRTAGCPAPPIQFPNASTLSQKRYLDQFLPGGWRGPPLISVTLISLWNFLSPFFCSSGS